MIKYAAGWNMPGYMPVNEPAEFESFYDARQYIVDQMIEDEDIESAAGNEDLAEEFYAAAEDVNLESEPFEYHVGGLVYWVTEVF